MPISKIAHFLILVYMGSFDNLRFGASVSGKLLSRCIFFRVVYTNIDVNAYRDLRGLIDMTVGVFFGGMSCEHDISIITGIQAVNALVQNYEVVPIYIDSRGAWYTGKKYFDIDNFKCKSSLGGHRVFLKAGDRNLYFKKSKLKAKLDVAVVCCHGLNGEDGTLQGLLQLSGVPYTGSSVLSSAMGMDKSFMKKVFESAGLPTLTCKCFKKKQFELEPDLVLSQVEHEFGYPAIVKPSNLGSSIGISVAHDSRQLVQSLKVAFEWDNSVVIEKALTDFVELNCAVLGGAYFETICSEIEQPKLLQEYLTYDDKYQTSNKYTSRNIPANVPLETRRLVQTRAREVFECLNCSGVARCDFLLHGDELYINEINTIPGSLSNYLFKYSGMSFETLLDNLIDIAFNEYRAKQRLRYAYDSNVLQNLELATKK